MSYIVYVIYNLVFQVFLIGFLFYANTYLNEFIIPDSLKWKEGRLRDDLTSLATAQAIVLLLEAILLIFLIYYINKRFLSGVAKVDNTNMVATWTAGVSATITVVFIVVLIYAAFK